MLPHPFIAAISFSIVLLFLAASAAVSAQPLPLRPLLGQLRPRRGGHHGPNHGHHRPAPAGHHSGRATPRYRNPVPIPNLNQNLSTADQNQTQDQSQNQEATLLSPSQGGAAGELNRSHKDNLNPGKLFGFVPKNGAGFDGSNNNLMEEFLHAHNWVRSKYNQPPFAWDEKLASFARQYLMTQYDDCKMVHSESEDYGENLFWGENLHWTPSDAVYYWYMEKEWFDFKTLTCSPPPQKSLKTCGHFTQIVWKDSARVGCALQHCRDPAAGMLIACEYDPPGNFENENPLEDNIAKHTNNS